MAQYYDFRTDFEGQQFLIRVQVLRQYISVGGILRIWIRPGWENLENGIVYGWRDGGPLMWIRQGNRIVWR